MWIWLLAIFLVIGHLGRRLLPRVAALAEDPAITVLAVLLVVGWIVGASPSRGH